MHKKQMLIYALILVTGFAIGWGIFGTGREQKTEQTQQQTKGSKATDEDAIWTCSMHPSVDKPEPGQCPICGMDLIKQKKGKARTNKVTFEMTEASKKLAQVETTPVKEVYPSKEIRMNGVVKADETQVVNQTAHFPGRIDRLYVNYTGQYVEEGQRLAELYSPELNTAQKELFEAMKHKETNPSMYKAAVNKLRLWKLPQSQIQSIIDRGEVQTDITFYSDVSGYVVEKNINYGDHIKSGTVMYQVANLDKIWVEFDAYERDIPWLNVGDSIVFEVSSMPGKTFTSKVTYIDPIIDPQTRVAKVRTELENPGKVLKPQMFATGVVHARLKAEEKQMVVPKSAVMWTGPRSVVYVQKEGTETPTFQYKEVELGSELGHKYVIKEGLERGQEVVTQGTFMIDASAQLQSKASMMNQKAAPQKMVNDHPGHEQSGDQQGAKMPDFKWQTPDAFQKQLGNFIQPYLSLKDALVNGDASKASEAAGQALEALDQVDLKLLEGKAHMAWMEQVKPMKEALQAISKHQDIKKLRDHFIPLSTKAIQSIKAFGVKATGPLYIQHCPMANDNQGADWLSLDKQIRNPYYGDQMLTCGSVTETISNE